MLQKSVINMKPTYRETSSIRETCFTYRKLMGQVSSRDLDCRGPLTCACVITSSFPVSCRKGAQAAMSHEQENEVSQHPLRLALWVKS